MSTKETRPYQQEAILAVESAWNARMLWPLVQMATGTGKTVVMAELIRRWLDRHALGRVLVIAERRELVEQTARRFAWWCEVDCGIEMQGRRDLTAPKGTPPRIVVATIQTLSGRLEKIPADVCLVMIDEAHHAVAKSYLDFLNALPDHAIGLGVTATPERADGAALAFAFDEIIYSYSVFRGIKEGYLAKVKPYIVRTGMDWSRVRTRAGDFRTEDVEREVMQVEALDATAKVMAEESADLPSMLFTASVNHAHELASRINAQTHPTRCRAIDGSHSTKERQEIIESAQRERGMLANCALLTEGFDWPDIRVLGIARPTKSTSLYQQMAGRGTRIAPGKDSVRILDFVPNNAKHSLVTSLDIFSGGLPEDVQEFAYKTAQNPDANLDMDQLIHVAREAYCEHQEAIFYELAARDPFRALGIREDSYREPAIRREPTERQIAALIRFGMDQEAVESISFHRAHTMLNKLIGRVEAGLATVKQIRVLARSGIDARHMTFADANAAIGVLAKKWKASRARG